MKTNLNAGSGQKADAQGQDKNRSTLREDYRAEYNQEEGRVADSTNRTTSSKHISWDQLKDFPKSDSNDYDKFLNYNYGPEQEQETVLKANKNVEGSSQTGYGSTPYNNRDANRSNSVKSERKEFDEGRVDRGGYSNQDPNK